MVRCSFHCLLASATLPSCARILTTFCCADRIIFAVAANISIASLNLSLMINSVGFYQIAKLLIIPFTAVVQSVWLNESLTLPQAACTAVVLVGVAIVCVPLAVSAISTAATAAIATHKAGMASVSAS